MKPLATMKKALQDIIEETFVLYQYDLKDIRDIAQNALRDHKKDIPKPDLDCPKGFIIGEEHGKYSACERCPKEFFQICNIYNFVWHDE